VPPIGSAFSATLKLAIKSLIVTKRMNVIALSERNGVSSSKPRNYKLHVEDGRTTRLLGVG
jgi:hypothetical protein